MSYLEVPKWRPGGLSVCLLHPMLLRGLRSLKFDSNDHLSELRNKAHLGGDIVKRLLREALQCFLSFLIVLVVDRNKAKSFTLSFPKLFLISSFPRGTENR